MSGQKIWNILEAFPHKSTRIAIAMTTTGSVTMTKTGSVAMATTGSVTMTTTEPVAKTSTEPVASTSTEQVAGGPVAESSTEPVASTSTEQVAGTIELVARKIAEPVARTSSKSVVGASTLCTSVAKANTSVARTGTEPVAKRTIKIDPKNAIFVFPTATKETGVKVGAKPAAVVLLFSQDCATIMLELDRIKPAKTAEERAMLKRDVETYLQQVEQTYSKEIYTAFLRCLFDFFKGRADAFSTFSEVTKLFPGNHNLIIGLNLFLPGKVRINPVDHKQGIKEHKLSYDAGKQLPLNQHLLKSPSTTLVGTGSDQAGHQTVSQGTGSQPPHDARNEQPQKVHSIKSPTTTLVWTQSDQIGHQSVHRVTWSQPPHRAGNQPAHQAGSQPPHQAGCQPPHQTGNQPSHQAGSQPPHQAGTQPPHQAGTQPLYQAGTQPLYQAGTQSPHQARTQPPYQAGTLPPHQAGTQSPHQAGTQPPNQAGSQQPYHARKQFPLLPGNQPCHDLRDQPIQRSDLQNEKEPESCYSKSRPGLESAQDYIIRVKTELGMVKYKEFVFLLQLMKEKKLTVASLTKHVASLFQGYPEFLQGFNLFVPGLSVIMGEGGSSSITTKDHSKSEDTPTCGKSKDITGGISEDTTGGKFEDTATGGKSVGTMTSEKCEDTTANRKFKDTLTSGKTSGKKLLPCQYCGKTFPKNSQLIIHLRTHTGEKPYKCVVCGRGFAQKAGINKHMAAMHREEQNHSEIKESDAGKQIMQHYIIQKKPQQIVGEKMAPCCGPSPSQKTMQDVKGQVALGSGPFPSQKTQTDVEEQIIWEEIPLQSQKSLQDLQEQLMLVPMQALSQKTSPDVEQQMAQGYSSAPSQKRPPDIEQTDPSCSSPPTTEDTQPNGNQILKPPTHSTEIKMESLTEDPVALSLNFHDYVPVSERVEKSPGKYLIDKTKHRASGESSSSDNDYQEMDQSSDTDTESASEEDTHKDIAETVDVKPKPPDNTDNPKGSVVPQKLYSNLHNVDTHNLAVYGKNVEMKEEFASDSETARDILNDHTGSDIHNEPDTDSETANDILNEHTARDILNEHTARDILNEHTDRDILNEPDSDSETARDIRNEHTAIDICNENNTNPGKVGDEQEIGYTDVEMKEELVSDSETSTDNLNEHITKSNEHTARDIFNEKTARDILNENNINTASYEKPKGIKTAICNDLSFDYIPLRSSSGRLIRKAKHWQPLENRRKRDALNMTGKSDPIPNKLRKIAKGNDTIDKRQHPSVGDQQTERNTLKNPRIPTGDSDMIQEESATKSRAKKACCVGCRCGLCREHCINCHKLFPVLRSKSKKRFHVTRPLAAPSGMSIKTFFESVLGYQVAVPLDVKLDQFVCDECYSIFSRFQRAREKFETVLSELKKMTSIDSVLYPGLEIGLKKLEDGSSKLLPVFNDSCDDNFQKQTASHISVTGNENDDQSENSGLAQTNENVSQIKYSSRNGGTQPIFQLKNRSIQRLLKQYGRMPTAKELQKERVCESVRIRNYKRAVRLLITIGPAAKAAVLNETVKIIRNEMKDFIRKKSILQGPLSIESVSSFRWEDALQEFDSLPWLSNCVKAAMCTKNAQDIRIPDMPGELGWLSPAFGLIMALILRARYPMKYILVPLINSLQMYEEKCTQKLFQLFSGVGFCVYKGVIKRAINTLKLQPDHQNEDNSAKSDERDNIAPLSDVAVHASLNNSGNGTASRSEYCTQRPVVQGMIKPGKGEASNKTPGRSHSIERNTMNDYEKEDNDNDIGDNDSINHDGESECEDLSDKGKGYDDKDDYNYMSEYEEASDCKSDGKDSEDSDITDKANRKVSHSSNDKSGKTYNDKDENDRVNEYEEASEYENSDDGSEGTDIADYTAWDVTHTTGMGENAVYWNVTDDGVTDCKNEDTLLNNLEKDGAVTEEIMEIDYFFKDPDNG